jgi:hypothetical protein
LQILVSSIEPSCVNYAAESAQLSNSVNRRSQLCNYSYYVSIDPCCVTVQANEPDSECND